MYDIVNRRWCPHHVLFVSVYISILPMSIFPPPSIITTPWLFNFRLPPPRLLPPPSIPDCRVEDQIKKHVPTSIRKKTHIEREQPPRGCKTHNAQNKCDSAIGQHLLENSGCTKMNTEDKFQITGQARSSLYLGVLESVYIKTQNPVLYRQKEFVFSLGLFNQEKGDSAPLVIKTTNHVRHFPLTWFSIRFWLFRFC